MVVRPVSHARLLEVVARWRRRAAETTGSVSVAYTQCANDVDLIVRDDETIQPLSLGGVAGTRPPPPPPSDRG